MRRAVVVLALALGLVVSLGAATYTKFEAVSIPATSTGFTAANINNLTGIHPPATQATCRLELAQVRYTVDGTTPSATVGTLIEIGDIVTVTSNLTLNAFRAFRTGAVSGQLDCTYSGDF